MVRWRTSSGDEDVEEVVPVAALAVTGVGVGHPDDLDAQPAQFGVEGVDLPAYLARGRDLGRRARLTERILHIDDHEGGLRRVERIEEMKPLSARQDPIDDLLADLDFVHRTPPKA